MKKLMTSLDKGLGGIRSLKVTQDPTLLKVESEETICVQGSL